MDVVGQYHMTTVLTCFNGLGSQSDGTKYTVWVPSRKRLRNLAVWLCCVVHIKPIICPCYWLLASTCSHLITTSHTSHACHSFSLSLALSHTEARERIHTHKRCQAFFLSTHLLIIIHKDDNFKCQTAFGDTVKALI